MNQPLFSVIIPTYNRPRPLDSCLTALMQLSYSRECFEVIVVDDGSQVPLEPVLLPYEGELEIRLIRQRNAGPASARNKGAEHARGRYLAFTDDDCAPAADWLDRLAARFRRAPDHLIGGRTLNALPQNPYASTTQLLLDYLYETAAVAGSTSTRFFTSNNFALPLNLFDAVGRFDPTMPLAAGEDREFCDRWLYCGYEMTYAPEVVVYHAHALNGRTFCKQHFNYGRGGFRFHQIRARRHQKSMRLEAPSFYWKLLSYPMMQRRNRQAPLLSGLLAVSQLANAAGFWWEMMRSSR